MKKLFFSLALALASFSAFANTQKVENFQDGDSIEATLSCGIEVEVSWSCDTTVQILNTAVDLIIALDEYLCYNE
jgi:hypothetical protein